MDRWNETDYSSLPISLDFVEKLVYWVSVESIGSKDSLIRGDIILCLEFVSKSAKNILWMNIFHNLCPVIGKLRDLS